MKVLSKCVLCRSATAAGGLAASERSVTFLTIFHLPAPCTVSLLLPFFYTVSYGKYASSTTE